MNPLETYILTKNEFFLTPCGLLTSNGAITLQFVRYGGNHGQSIGSLIGQGLLQ
jgi:hypothetical protein